VTVTDYEVELTRVPSVRTVVVAAVTTWPEFGTLWQPMLDEVWGCLRANGITSGCRNVMRYRDDRPAVEVGVIADPDFALTGRVVTSRLPRGLVATTTHRGGYAGLDGAHRAVHDWCAANDRPLTGERWEVYGPHDDDPANVWVEVSWRVAARKREPGSPAAAARAIAPILPVRDLDRSLAFYASLGFATSPYEDGDYGFARLGRVELHLGVDAEAPPTSAYLFVHDADSLAATWAAAGAEVHPPVDTPWRQHEGVLVDPDGNRIRFGSPVRTRS
jgi:effector-binding domain-containing protein/predicted enzyme related to lactoylglutathione lyase